MTEYISRKAAIETIMSEPTDAHYPSWYADKIESISVADVAPVRHGHWILEREPNGNPYCFHCSVCDDDFHYIGITAASDYCPNCGARMDALSNLAEPEDAERNRRIESLLKKGTTGQ